MKREWWESVFDDRMGELIFAPRMAQSAKEVEKVISAAKIRKNERVLDLACGVGRHCFEFAKRGMNVVGLDFSSDYIRSAKKRLAQKGKISKRLEFVRGDMKKLREFFEPQSFDVVVSLFNSFGYFSKKSDDAKMLKEVSRVLCPGGRFVLNTIHAPGAKYQLATLPKLQGLAGFNRIVEVGPGRYFLDRARYDERTQKAICRWRLIDVKKRSERKIDFSQNVYSHAQLKQHLAKLGLRVSKLWGPLAGGSFDAKKSWHQSFVAVKRSDSSR